jgi:hypothetical protein
MPTFVFIKNRQTLETIKGANPAAIEAAIRKHAGPPQRNYVESASGAQAPQDKALQGHVSGLEQSHRAASPRFDLSQITPQGPLNDQIDTSQTLCLNESSTHTLKSLLSSDDKEGYLESDADEQLLLSISFLQNVKLFAFRLTTEEGEVDKAPKTLKVFNDANGIGFDEATSGPAAMEVELTRDQALGKQLVLTRYVKFQKANSVSVSLAGLV